MSPKRVLASNSCNAPSAPKSAKAEGSTPHCTSTKSTGHLMVQALDYRVLAFLTTPDVALLLNCCKAFRNDSDLVRSVLERGAVSAYGHYVRGDHDEGDESDEDDEKNNDEDDEKNETITRVGFVIDTTITAQPNAQLVSLIATFEKLILPMRPKFEQRESSRAEDVFSVPVAISLWDHHPDKQKLQAGHEWTREDVHVALNAIHEGFGDRFTEVVKGVPSSFGAHWEQVEMSAGGGITCTICGKRRYFAKRLKAVVVMTKPGDHSVLDALSASGAGQKLASF